MPEEPKREIAPYLKQKIGQHLSYPLKFSELCNSLGPAIERLGIEVWFWAWKPPKQNEVRDHYQVFEAKYSPRTGEWRILIAPIPRQMRPAVHRLLVPLLETRVRSWLLREQELGWLSADHALRISYGPGAEDLQIDEHNAP